MADNGKQDRDEYVSEFSTWMSERGKVPVTIITVLLVAGFVAFAIWGN